jgi:hypothetical protein
VIPLERLTATARVAQQRGLRVHLDGARLWNAAVATGVPLERWAEPFDTVMMCFSKGLGAPVGSILAGDKEVVARARRLRKMFGGGIRQGGVLAAACLYALDHHVDRLADDHRRAERLAEIVQGAPGLAVDPARVDTNIVLFELTDPSAASEAAVGRLRERGLWMVPFGPRTLRAITHLDVDDTAIERAGCSCAGSSPRRDRRRSKSLGIGTTSYIARSKLDAPRSGNRLEAPLSRVVVSPGHGHDGFGPHRRVGTLARADPGAAPNSPRVAQAGPSPSAGTPAPCSGCRAGSTRRSPPTSSSRRSAPPTCSA